MVGVGGSSPLGRTNDFIVVPVDFVLASLLHFPVSPAAITTFITDQSVAQTEPGLSFLYWIKRFLIGFLALSDYNALRCII
ncbi:hypothetical protein LA635_1554 [Erwinia amylovora LA635]|uniref:Uncharacterized protein n=2 Tax=Erwinia amylovora TaxID=552 RepID=D4I2C7_ERWAC|nr:hypothetical protein predicted by Glimmer/Critica [Erwinia amylovora CFBP1430]CDK15178.1 hypothetical protein LA635_1554 [Erwinia amylovora LA635]CDK18545.1 hypothetical protein LA636_1553 [Erwinia amylovora LA636]CDK21914.1 hypothetical protein LA637_1554 [Erwinia amylovora LA637]